MQTNIKLGSHVGNSGHQMLIGSITDAIYNGANCFMVYLGAPQNTIRKPIVEQNADKMLAIAEKNNINPEDIIVHAPYIVNIARMDHDKYVYGIDILRKELIGVKEIGVKYMVLHPGSAVDSTRDEAIIQIANGINRIFEQTKDDNTVICLETMAGKGNEIGRTFEEIRMIIELINDKTRIGVCLDTCHINDAGYDLINNYEQVINDFDKIIGIDYLKVIHLNDSKNPCGAHKDRHENIGFGTIGFDTLYKVLTDERFKNVPKILETPFVDTPLTNDTYSPYLEEIKMLKSGIFNPNLKEEVLKRHIK